MSEKFNGIVTMVGVNVKMV